MADFTIGPWSLVSAHLLSAGTAAYALFAAGHTRRGFRQHLADRWSSLGTTLCLVAIAILLWTVGPRVLPSPSAPSLLAVLVGSAMLALGYTALRLQRVLDRIRAHLPPIPVTADEEARRKTPHLMMGLITLYYVGLGTLLMTGLALTRLADTQEAYPNLVAARDAPVWVAGHLLGLWWVLFLLYALLPVELIRLRAPDAPFPFKRTILSRLRSHEAGLLGAHVHMTAGLATAWLLVAPDPTTWSRDVPACLAILVVTVFADSASALAGRRWGRTKWFHNPNKSYLGSAAGTFVAFAVTVPLVGPAVAVLCAAVFLTMDVLGPVPFPVSDNLLNPLGLAVVLMVVRDAIHPLIPGF